MAIKSKTPKSRSVKKSIKGLCVKCKKQVVIKNVEKTETVNGQPMLRGKCAECGTTVCKFVKKQ